MVSIQDQLNVAEQVLSEKYEINVVFTGDDGLLREQEAVTLTADGVVDKVANGIAKIRLTNIKIKKENGALKTQAWSDMLHKSVTIRVDL